MGVRPSGELGAPPGEHDQHEQIDGQPDGRDPDPECLAHAGDALVLLERDARVAEIGLGDRLRAGQQGERQPQPEEEAAQRADDQPQDPSPAPPPQDADPRQQVPRRDQQRQDAEDQDRGPGEGDAGAPLVLG